MGNYKTEDFITLYPGAFSEKEKAPAEEYLELIAAIKARGEVDGEALARGELAPETPGIGPSMEVTEALVRYNNEKYDPENPLLHDSAYAQSAGYQDIFAYPGLGPHDNISRPFPATARDTMLVSQVAGSITSFAPVYPGDTLHLVIDENVIDDLTPTEGDTYRHLALSGNASLYNQNGEKVQEIFSGAMESVRVFKEGKRPEKMEFADIWEAPDWMRRPAHYYTDADWDYIISLWQQEKLRGPEKLYWEDVRVGEEPTITVDGPIIEGPLPAPQNGMGLGGSYANLKHLILDEEKRRTLLRDEKTGMYLPQNREDAIPPLPAGVEFASNMMGGLNEADIHKTSADRGVLLNFLGRDMAVRHLNNWMGDSGWLYNIRWNIMPAETHADYGKPVPKASWFADHLAPVPAMQGKTINTHGLSQDLALVRSYVYDKHVRNGKYCVELAWWIETIEGDIYIAGGATIQLPSRNAAR